MKQRNRSCYKLNDSSPGTPLIIETRKSATRLSQLPED